VRIAPIAELSLALMRDRSRFGIAMAAMMAMIATTIINSISVKPLFLLITPTSSSLSALSLPLGRALRRVRTNPSTPQHRREQPVCQSAERMEKVK